MRVLILALVLSACVAKSAPLAPVQPPAPAPVTAPAPKPEPPRNLVCEAFKGVNDKAVCTPYLTRADAQTAMIVYGGQQIHCAYTLDGVRCHDPILIVQSPPAPVQDSKPPAGKTKKPEPKK